MFYKCVVCLGDPCNEVHGMLLLLILTLDVLCVCLFVYICVCNIEWSMRQDYDSGLHIMLLSTKSLKLRIGSRDHSSYRGRSSRECENRWVSRWILRCCQLRVEIK